LEKVVRKKNKVREILGTSSRDGTLPTGGAVTLRRKHSLSRKARPLSPERRLRKMAQGDVGALLQPSEKREKKGRKLKGTAVKKRPK